MEDQDLIRKGNAIIAAAREGTANVSEDEMKRLQKNYLKVQKAGSLLPSLQGFSIVLMIIGFGTWMDGDWFFGMVILAFGTYLTKNLFEQEADAKKYPKVVEKEFPKIQSKAA